MKLSIAAAAPKQATPIFILTSATLRRHALFGALAAADARHLESFAKKYGDGPRAGHHVFLPSGKEAIAITRDKNEKLTHRRAILLMREIVQFLRRERVASAAFSLDDVMGQGSSPAETAELLGTQLEIANFDFTDYKTPPKGGWHSIKELAIVSRPSAALTAALRDGQIIGEEINGARALSNMPGGDMTPKRLAREALSAGRRAKIKVNVLGKSAIEKLKMGGILGVARGSSEEPKFIIMEYVRGKRGEAPVVLVGKGVTFDTGGLNLKPSSAIYEMHMDMSGGAAVIHILAAIARLGIKKNIVGLIPAVENMPSGSSYRPGDVLRTLSGKTIEVMNTDAEGRVILAEGLEYAKRYKPRLVIDIATLTGAAEVALGKRASAVFTTDDALATLLTDAGERTGDFAWQLPLWEEFEPEIKGTFGDFSNTGKHSRAGGAITGAVFLWQFIKGYRWAHFDISPRMTSVEGDHLTKGAAGASIALLTRFLRDF